MDKALHAAYFSKTVEVRWAKKRVKIDLATDVFSSHQIDVGSRFLLRQMETADVRYGRVLDVGCGVGVLGLGLRAMGRAARVMGFDRDAAAVAFANHNAEQNGIDGARFDVGLAYEPDAVGAEPFDAVVSNVPAKAGDGVHRLMLLGAGRLLTDGGRSVDRGGRAIG
jgi:16S rRNA (guanine1207-N2)-methyltransferase